MQYRYVGVMEGKHFHLIAADIQLLAILPGTALYVFLGASTEQLVENAMTAMEDTGSTMPSHRKVTISVIVIGAILGAGAIYLTTRYARRELRRILDERGETACEDCDPQEESVEKKSSSDDVV